MIPAGNPAPPAVASLNWIDEGYDGQLLVVRTLQTGADAFTINVQNDPVDGNIRTAGGTIPLIGERAGLLLQYSQRIAAWVHVDPGA